MARRRVTERIRKAGRAAAEREIEGQGCVPLGGACAEPDEQQGGWPCAWEAGTGTDHPGVGPCRRHGGNTRFWRVKGAWIMAHSFVGEEDITPWEALLRQVRRTAYEMTWLDMKIANCPSDDELLPGGEFYPWVRMRNETFNRHTRVAKMAVDAGVAQWLISKIELEGQTIANVVNRTLAVLNLTDEQLDVARAMLRRELLALDAGAIEGEEVDDEGRDNVL